MASWLDTATVSLPYHQYLWFLLFPTLMFSTRHKNGRSKVLENVSEDPKISFSRMLLRDFRRGVCVKTRWEWSILQHSIKEYQKFARTVTAWGMLIGVCDSKKLGTTNPMDIMCWRFSMIFHYKIISRRPYNTVSWQNILAIIFRIDPNHSCQVNKVTRSFKGYPSSLASIYNNLLLIDWIFVHFANQVVHTFTVNIIPSSPVKSQSEINNKYKFPFFTWREWPL